MVKALETILTMKNLSMTSISKLNTKVYLENACVMVCSWSSWK